MEVSGSVLINGSLVVNQNSGNIQLVGDAELDGDVGITGTLTLESSLKTKNVEPITNNLYSLGTPLLRYNSIHTTNMTVYGNLTITGTLSGNATSATVATVASRLNADTTLSIIGDVQTVSPVSLNYGQGGSITLNTVISNNIINDRTRLTDVTLDDDILVYRSGSTVTNKMSRRLFISDVIPVGTVVPFAGKIAPSGWSICDGREIDRNTHINLAIALGYDINDPGQYLWGTATDPAKIKLPDLRGRMLLGWVDPNNLTPPVGTYVTNASANTIGSYGGNEKTYITKDQLPEHEHALDGDSGTQFYVTSPSPGSTDSNSVSYLGVGDSVGSALPITSGIEGVSHTTQVIGGIQQQVGNELQLMNPYVTINYIIYHGGPGV